MLLLVIAMSIDVGAQQTRFLCTGSEPACSAASTARALIDRQGLLPNDYMIILVPDTDWQRVARAFRVDTPFGFTLLPNRRIYLNSTLMSQAGSMPALVVAHETAHVICKAFSESAANRAARKILVGFREGICD